MGNSTTIEQIRETLAILTPTEFEEVEAYTHHLLEAQEAGEPSLGPAEFSEMYRAQREAFSKEGLFFLMAAGFSPLYQRVTWGCIVKAAREHPEISPGELLPIVAAEMDAVNRLMQEPSLVEEDTAETVRGGLPHEQSNPDPANRKCG
jgi:hypothetical protein